MSGARSQTSGILIHRSRAYDLFFGWLIRRSDAGVLARAGVAPGDRVLDVGTGPGYLALAAARLVGPDGFAVGIDASPEMIDRARELAAREGSSVEYRVASAEALPFADGSLDVVVTRLVLHHLPAAVKRSALAEIMRVLAPSGRVLVADFASPAVQGAHHVAAHVLGDRPETVDPLGRLLWDAGFRGITSGRLLYGMLAGARGEKP